MERRLVSAGGIPREGRAEGARHRRLSPVLELNEDDVFGAGLKLSILGDRAQPATPPVAYVEQLFDDYADRFETALVEKLDYKVPGRLAALIEAKGRAHYAHAIDLGCGTGLMGVELRARVDHLEGYDLSANMLAKAEDKRFTIISTRPICRSGQARRG